MLETNRLILRHWVESDAEVCMNMRKTLRLVRSPDGRHTKILMKFKCYKEMFLLVLSAMPSAKKGVIERLAQLNLN